MEQVFVGMKVSYSNGVDTEHGNITQVGSNGRWFEYHFNVCEAKDKNKGMGHQDWEIKTELTPPRNFAKLVNGKWLPAVLNEQTGRLKIIRYSSIHLNRHIRHYCWEF